MPTYEYECTSCGQHIEVYQRITEDPLSTCGACGGSLRKVFHPAGIVFKGSGFYATDSRSSSKPASKAKKDGEGGTSTTSSASSDSGTGSSDSGKGSSGSDSSSGGSSSSGSSKERSSS
jgi:putative FmdB family regulatory protein